MKRLIVLVLIVAAAMSSKAMDVLTVSKGALALQGSYCAIEGGFTYRYFDNDDGTITLSPYDRNGMYVGAGISPSPVGDFTLPEVIDGKRVAAIGDYFFNSSYGMTSLVLPATVTNISVYAISGVSTLTNITVAAENLAYKSVDGILYTKDGKTLVACPKGKGGNIVVASGTERIAANAFYNNNQLVSVELPEGLTAIESYAFYSCVNYINSFTSVTIPETVEDIGEYAFAGCIHLAKVTFAGAEDDINIADTAFLSTPYDAGKPFSLIIKSQYFSIDNLHYGYYPTLIGFHGQMPESLVMSEYLDGQPLTVIGSSALSPWQMNVNIMSSVTNVVVPEGVFNLGSLAFRGNVKLESVSLPASLRYINHGAFGSCTSLREIRIPSGVTSIAYGVFYGCENLTVYAPSTLRDTFTVPDGCAIEYYDVAVHTVTFDAKGGSFSWLVNGNFTPVGTATSTVVEGLEIGSLPSPWRNDVLNAYFLGWYDSYGNKVTASTVVTSDLTLEARWAMDDGTFQMVVVDGMLVRCFGQCPATLSASDWPEGVTAIASYAFQSKSTLVNVEIPVGVTEIGDYAFGSCYSLTNVTLPANVTEIGDYAFGYCSSLANVTFAGGRENVDWLSDTAFYNTPYERSLPFVMIVKDGVVTGFHGTCPSVLAASDWPEGVTAIANCAFQSCYSLTGVTIPAGVTEIGDYAFVYCSSLANVTFAGGRENVDWLSDTAFYNTPYDRTLPFAMIVKDGVVTGFHGTCPSVLAASDWPEGVTAIASYAFQSKSTLVNVEIPVGVTEIGDYAFGSCYSLTNVTLPANVTEIGDYAFGYCSSLANVTFEGDMGSIDMTVAYAFWETPWLDAQPFGWVTYERDGEVYLYSYYGSPVPTETLVIPDGVIGIIHKDFWKSGLPRFDTQWDGEKYWRFLGWYTAADGGERVDPVNWRDYSEVAIAGGTTLYAHWEEAEPEWRFDITDDCNAILWGNSVSLVGAVDIPASVTVEEVDGNCDMVEVSYPVTAIGESAFYGMDGITSVSIPTSVVRVGYEAFYGCSESLFDTATIPGVKLVDGWAVGYTEELLGDLSLTGVRGIGGGAFEGCEGLISVTIPDGVTSICEGAFCDCDSLTNVTIQADVTSIGEYAFSYCIGLTSLAIPASVTNIEDWAFEYCDGLTNVVFEGGMESVVMNVFSAFYGTPWLQTYVAALPKPGNDDFVDAIAISGESGSVTGTNGGAGVEDGEPLPPKFASTATVWWKWTAPKSGICVFDTQDSSFDTVLGVYAGSAVDELDIVADNDDHDVGSTSRVEFEVAAGTTYYIAVGGYENLMGDIVLSWSLTAPEPEWYYVVIEKDGDGRPLSVAIEGCSVDFVGELMIPSSIEMEYGDGVISVPVVKIEEWAFEARAYTSVTIPDSVTSIGNFAFLGCEGLTSVTIPNGVTTIGINVFSECYSLASVMIPDSMTSIGYGAFAGCIGLQEFVVAPDNPAYTAVSGLLVSKDRETLIAVPGGQTSVTIPDCVTSIGEGAFGSCYNLTDVTITNSVISIGEEAFESCFNLTSVTIPDSVTSIGEWAFYGCSGLSVIMIPDSVTSIGDGAFAGCRGLANSDGFVIVRNVLYSYSGEGSEITIPDGVTSVGASAFQFYEGLTSVTIPDSVTSIGHSAFYGCSRLSGITIPDTVTSIGEWAFYNCTGLADNDGFVIVRNVIYSYSGEDTEIMIPNDVTCIGAGAFNGCNGLTDVTIPDGVASIGDYAFAWCSGLTSVMIPDNVTSIGGMAFYGCSGLTSVTIPDRVTSIGEGAFTECALTDAYLPKSLEGHLDTSVVFDSGTSIHYRSNDNALPEVSVDATPEAVTNAIEKAGFIDAGVIEAIGGSAEEYNAFKIWADGVKGATCDTLAGEAAVVANAHAAAAYLLGAERLFENEPAVEIDELAVADGESAGTTAMTVAVTVKDGENAVKCAAEKVKEMFEATGDLGDWNGAAKLTPAVTISGTDASGKMTFVVTPGDGTANRAFLRIKR